MSHIQRRTSSRCTCSQIDPHEADCALDPRPPPTEPDTCPWRWVDDLLDLPCEIRRGWHRVGVAGDVLHEFTISPGAGIKAVEWVDQLHNTTQTSGDDRE